jgi:hypothetical protein
MNQGDQESEITRTITASQSESRMTSKPPIQPQSESDKPLRSHRTIKTSDELRVHTFAVDTINNSEGKRFKNTSISHTLPDEHISNTDEAVEVNLQIQSP